MISSSRPYRSLRPLLTRTLVPVLLTLGLLACSSGQGSDSAGTAGESRSAPNTLTEAEKEAGWTLLFDGANISEHWVGLGRDAVPARHWRVDQQSIFKVEDDSLAARTDGEPPEGGDLMTKETYRDFEFAFEWKLAEGANSGIKYNVSESLSTAHSDHHALGFEYQVFDDPSQDLEPNQLTGGLYDMIPPSDAQQLNPPGEWNSGRIVLDGMHGEHWVNGEKVVEFDMDSARFDSLFAASKYVDIEGFRNRRAGHLVLQDHGDAVWYRNLRVRRLSD